MLVSVLPLLLRRLEANALLPGTIKEEELDFYAHMQAAAKKAQNQLIPPPSGLQTLATTLGYVTLLSAMQRCLDLLSLKLWTVAQRRMGESFVL